MLIDKGGYYMDRAKLKSLAKEQIKGHILILFLITLVVAIVSTVVASIPVVGSIAAALVVYPVFSISMVIIYLNLTQYMTPEIGELFAHFNKFWAAFKVTFFTGLFTALWSLLFVIPGIIKAYSYSMAMYILAENPEIGALEAINRSKAMMDGHKMELFVLNLSFIGWYLLCAVTLGIAGIWVVPYVSATTANFYNSIKNTVAEA